MELENKATRSSGYVYLIPFHFTHHYMYSKIPLIVLYFIFVLSVLYMHYRYYLLKRVHYQLLSFNHSIFTFFLTRFKSVWILALLILPCVCYSDWDVVYCSRPTSPGGGYRSAIGRLFFNTKQMVQVVEAPDIVRNKVTLSVLGFLDAEVSLKGMSFNYLKDVWNFHLLIS